MSNGLSSLPTPYSTQPTTEDGRLENMKHLNQQWLSAHFIFTDGSVEEVPYDPDLYFHGEEPSLAARSYTHGTCLHHTSIPTMNTPIVSS